MNRYNGSTSGYCPFGEWKEHYAENAAQAVWHWLKNHKDMQGSPLYYQMEEIFAQAMIRSNRQWQIEEYLEALYK